MKKTFTILAVATVLTSAAFAQYDGNRRNDNKYDNNNSHDVVVNNFPTRGNGYNDRGDSYFSEREKDIQIAQINQE
jgi:Ni/Co efflux regulator RcnB